MIHIIDHIEVLLRAIVISNEIIWVSLDEEVAHSPQQVVSQEELWRVLIVSESEPSFNSTSLIYIVEHGVVSVRFVNWHEYDPRPLFRSQLLDVVKASLIDVQSLYEMANDFANHIVTDLGFGLVDLSPQPLQLCLDESLIVLVSFLKSITDHGWSFSLL